MTAGVLYSGLAGGSGEAGAVGEGGKGSPGAQVKESQRGWGDSLWSKRGH